MLDVLRQPAPKMSVWDKVRRRLQGMRRRREIESSISKLAATAVVTRLEGFGGLFELPLSNNMTHRLLMGGYESKQQLLLSAAVDSGDHVIDVGANLGLFSVMCAAIVGKDGKVLAAEPVPQMLNILRSNIARNKLENVIVFAGAVTNTRQTCEIHTVEGGEEYSSLQSIAHPDRPEGKEVKIAVPGIPLDELVEQHGLRPAIIKVDTEGAEGLVFSGAKQTLTRDRPIVLSELDDRLLKGFDWSSGKVVELFQSCKYRVLDQATQKVLSPACNYFVGDILAIPEEAA